MAMLNEQEVEYLKEIYKGRFVPEIVQMINAKFNANHNHYEISNAKTKYGLKSGIKSVFKKGDEPHNKGKKWEDYVKAEVRERCLKTAYKKGNIPKNTLPIGAERKKEQYIEVKVAQPNVWKKKHVVMWEKANGEIPEGHVVAFADGNPANLTLDNLMLLSKGEMLQINKLFSLTEKNRETMETCLQIVRLNQTLNSKGMKKIKKAEYNKKYLAEYRKRKK